MLGLTFSFKMDWGSYIIIAFKKIGALIRSMKFLSPEVVLYLYKSAGLLVLHLLLPVLNSQFIVKMYPVEIFSRDITLVDVHLNWPNWFHFLILERGLLIILIDCTILSPFQILQGCLCQQFLSLHSQTQLFSADRILSFSL